MLESAILRKFEAQFMNNLESLVIGITSASFSREETLLKYRRIDAQEHPFLKCHVKDIVYLFVQVVICVLSQHLL